MNVFKKVIFIIRMVFFILQFYGIYLSLNVILQVKIVGYVFLCLYLIYSIKIILEWLSKNDIYKEDLIYNFMQVGMHFYMFILIYRIWREYMVVMTSTMKYFQINYTIMSILLIFILIYSFLELDKRK